jgi:hypothetical protein
MTAGTQNPPTVDSPPQGAREVAAKSSQRATQANALRDRTSALMPDCERGDDCSGRCPSTRGKPGSRTGIRQRNAGGRRSATRTYAARPFRAEGEVARDVRFIGKRSATSTNPPTTGRIRIVAAHGV